MDCDHTMKTIYREPGVVHLYETSEGRVVLEDEDYHVSLEVPPAVLEVIAEKYAKKRMLSVND